MQFKLGFIQHIFGPIVWWFREWREQRERSRKNAEWLQAGKRDQE